MEYVAPINGDQGNPERAYIDGDPSVAQVGSIPSARFFNLLMNEARNLVEGAGLTLDPNDDAQWLAAIQQIVSNGAYLQKSVSETVTAGFWTMPVAASIAAGVLSFDPALGNRFTATAAEPLTIAAPGALPAGGSARLELAMDATGNHAIGFDAAYRIAAGAIDTDPLAVNLIHMEFASGGVIDVHITQRGA